MPLREAEKNCEWEAQMSKASRKLRPSLWSRSTQSARSTFSSDRDDHCTQAPQPRQEPLPSSPSFSLYNTIFILREDLCLHTTTQSRTRTNTRNYGGLASFANSGGHSHC